MKRNWALPNHETVKILLPPSAWLSAGETFGTAYGPVYVLYHKCWRLRTSRPCNVWSWIISSIADIFYFVHFTHSDSACSMSRWARTHTHTHTPRIFVCQQLPTDWELFVTVAHCCSSFDVQTQRKKRIITLADVAASRASCRLFTSRCSSFCFSSASAVSFLLCARSLFNRCTSFSKAVLAAASFSVTASWRCRDVNRLGFCFISGRAAESLCRRRWCHVSWLTNPERRHVASFPFSFISADKWIEVLFRRR